VALKEAKIRRQPPEKELSRSIALIVGAASGIGRAAATLAAERGAHVMIADRDLPGAESLAADLRAAAGKEFIAATGIDIRDRASIAAAISATVMQFGGLDILVNTAAIFPSSPTSAIADTAWAATLDLNVTANYLPADEAAQIFRAQALDASILLTSSANAVVPRKGSEAYDVSKAALSHLVRELAISLSPSIRVNGISPATVVKGSTMFPRDRVIASLQRYSIDFDPAATDDQLRDALAAFYPRHLVRGAYIP
jgi:NAD(P)-dependent dehydrogenase (short-subunit alcohol dehydrogenase family)